MLCKVAEIPRKKRYWWSSDASRAHKGADVISSQGTRLALTSAKQPDPPRERRQLVPARAAGPKPSLAPRPALPQAPAPAALQTARGQRPNCTSSHIQLLLNLHTSRWAQAVPHFNYKNHRLALVSERRPFRGSLHLNWTCLTLPRSNVRNLIKMRPPYPHTSH